MLPGTAAEPGHRVIGRVPAHVAEPILAGPRNVASQTYGLILARQFCFVQSRRTRDEIIAVRGNGGMGPLDRRSGGDWLHEGIAAPRGARTRCGVEPT